MEKIISLDTETTLITHDNDDKYQLMLDLVNNNVFTHILDLDMIEPSCECLARERGTSPPRSA